MRKILIDTNIVLDLALERAGFVEGALELLRFTAKNKIKLCITASSVTDIYYVLRKQKGHESAVGLLKKLFQFSKVLGVDQEIITEALNSEMKDFEDAVQTETAIHNDIGIIVTRDKKDYEHSGLQVFSPIEYINELKIR